MRKPLCGIGFAVVLAALFCCPGLSAQEPDEPVAAGSVFEIGKAEVGLEDDFNVKPKVQATYTHPVTKKEGLKASAKVVNKIGPKDPADTADCEWTKRIPLYDKKLLSVANKAGTFTAAWLADDENEDQNQPLALPLSLTSKQVPGNALNRTIHLAPPLIYDVVVEDGFITITGRWFGTKKPKAWFEYLNAKDQVKRLNCKIGAPDGEDGRVNAKLKPVYMNPADGTSKVVVQVPKLPKGVASLDDLSHVVLDSGSGLAADTELYGVTFDLDGKGTRTGGGELLQAVKHGQAATEPEVQANAGWTYTGWDVAFDNVTEPLAVTAQYELKTYLLTYTAGPNGLVNGAAQVTQIVAHGSDGPSVEAQPSANHHFVAWSDASTDNPRQDLSVTGTLSVTANFAIDSYSVTFDLDGKGTRTGGGELSQVIEHGAAASAPEVEPDSGWVFTGWDVTFDSITANLTVTAQYEVATYLLTYTAGPNGQVNGAAQITQIVAHGSDGPVVTPQPAANHHFVAWSDASADNPRQDLSVTGTLSVTATFAINTYLITGTVSGDIAASVTVTLTGDAAMTTTTGVDGSYSFEVPAGSYTVTPSQDGCMFTPSNREVTITDADSNGNDFAASFAYLVLNLPTGQVTTSTKPADLLTNADYKSSKMVFRRIPAGTFTMGSPEDELGRYSDREFQHQVTLTEDFYIGVFEVTQAQYKAVMSGADPSDYKGDDRPVETVSWNTIRGGTWPSGAPAAETFMDRLRALVGAGYLFDLPTEAQWEYACRAGTTTALNSGKNLTDIYECSNVAEVGRYGFNNSYQGGVQDGKGGYLEYHTAVGSYQPNDWGLYDMHGNVVEWCLDWYVADLGVDPVTDPVGHATGSVRVIRGGCWFSFSWSCRSANQDNYAPSGTNGTLGFRVALAPQ
jgi:formylglycine-generating enzyme required for sulfatase activity